MSGLFGLKRNLVPAKRLAGVQIQTSLYGQPIPLVYGMNRLAGNMIWYGDFQSKPDIAGNTLSTGKGGGSIKQTQQYVYTAAVALALCEGPINAINAVWDNNGNATTTTVTEEFTVPVGGGTVTVANAAHITNDLGVSQQESYSQYVNDFGNPDGSYTSSGYYRQRMHSVAASPSAGQYSQSNGVYTFNSADAGKTVEITYSFASPSTSTSGQPLETFNFSLFPGTRPQTAWGFLTSNFPSQALGYAGLAYVADSSMYLGVSGTAPNISLEVLGMFPFGGGITDANPADILTDIFTDPNHGLGLDSSLLGDLTQWSNFCVANGIFISPVLTSQQAASELLKEMLEVTNSTAVWSDGQLKIVPYGDTTAIGNGVTFTPDTQPIYDLTDDDFAPDAGAEPVQVSRADVADAFNAVQIEFVNRSKHYNAEICEEKNETAISLHGLRVDTVRSYHSITSQTVAAMAANAILKRNIYIIATYKFQTDWRYALLEPMDMVTLPASRLGLDKTPVRITRVTEKPDGRIEFEAEEFPWGTAQPTLYPKQASAPYLPQDQADPGDVNAPTIFESTSRQNNYSGYQLNVAVSGASAEWGGCHIWASADGASYQLMGTVKNPANMGTLSATLASGSDPDTANTLSVDLTESLGELISASNTEADNFQTLCYVDGELIAFGTATLTAAYKYDLTYLRRGVYGTTIAAHPSGSKFCRLDAVIFQCDLDPDWVGKTLYLKFTSFNTRGKMEQSLADATEYTYAIAGTGPGSIGSDGVVVPNAIDFSKSYLNKNLGHVPDDPVTDRNAGSANQIAGGGYGYLGLTSSGNFQSGRYLGGDSGVQAIGGGGRVGFDRTPSTYPVEVAGNILATQASPSFVARDTAAGWDNSWSSVSGQIYEYRDGVLRRQITAVGSGFDRTPSTYQVEVAGDAYLNAANPTFHAEDTGAGGVQGAWNSNGGVVSIYRAGTQRQLLNGTGTGLEGTPSFPLHVLGSGLIRAEGSSGGFSATDRTGAGDFTLYRNGTSRLYDGGSAADVLNINSSGEMGLAGSTPVSGYPLSHGGTGIIDGSSNLNPLLALAGKLLALGDMHDYIHATIGGAGGVGLDNVSDGSTYKRLTGVSSGNQAQTASILGGAVTVAAQASGPASAIDTNDGAQHEWGSVTLTPNGGYVRLIFQGTGTTNIYNVTLKLYRGDSSGTLLYSGNWPVQSVGGIYWTLVVLDTSPGTGSVTYTAYVTGTATRATSVDAGGTLLAENLKV